MRRRARRLAAALALASGACSGAKSRPTTSCADAPAAAGSYSYRVVASFRTWTAISAEAGPVTIMLDSVAPTVLSIDRLDPSPTRSSPSPWDRAPPAACSRSRAPVPA